jgi:hypothetical protein
MSYLYTRTYGGLGDLGYSYPRGSCSQVNQGESRCFRSSEASIASRAGCLSVGSACEVGGDSGTSYCCPPGSLANEPAGATAEPEGRETVQASGKGIVETVTEWAGDLFDPTKGGGATPQQPTAQGFAQYARQVTGEESARAEMEALPIEAETAIPWYQRYQTHITIASTVVGLGAFGLWLYVQSKGKS